ncbi:ead/Ea22-like family protein [Escherichia coli]
MTIDYQALREAAEVAKEETTWQNLQAFHAAATPEVVLALLDVLDASLEAKPVAWTDEEELRDVKRYGLGEIFQYPPDKYADSRRVIPLYRVPPASIVQAQGIEIAINELVALSPRLDKRAAETLSMAVAQLRKLVKKQLQAKD